MAMIRFTMWFGYGKNGWSETYFHNAATFSQQLEDDCNKLLFRRMQLMGNNVEVDYARCSDDLVKRDSFPIDVANNAQGNQPWNENSDFGFVAQLAKISSTATLTRQLYIRGIPDIFTIATNGNITDANWVQKFLRMGTELKNGRWCMKSVDRTGNPNKPIEAFIKTAGDVVILQITGHGFLDGQKITVGNVRTQVGMNKQWRIKKVNDDTFSLIGYPLSTVTGVFAGDGYAYKAIYALSPFIDFSKTRITSHRAGRRFGTPVGRRKRRGA